MDLDAHRMMKKLQSPLLKKIKKCIEILNKDWLKLDSIYLKMSGINI
jgi:hypothetical protein